MLVLALNHCSLLQKNKNVLFVKSLSFFFSSNSLASCFLTVSILDIKTTGVNLPRNKDDFYFGIEMLYLLMFFSSRVVPYYRWVYSVLCCLAWRPSHGEKYSLEVVNLTNNMPGCAHVLSFIKFCVVPHKPVCPSDLVWLVCFTFVCGSHTSDYQHFLKNYLHVMFLLHTAYQVEMGPRIFLCDKFSSEGGDCEIT